MALTPAPQRRVAAAELMERAAAVESHFGPGSSADPCVWARAVTLGIVPQSDGTPFVSAPFPRTPKTAA